MKQDRFPPRMNSPRFWRISAALGLISLAGCATSNSPPPAVEIRTVTVEKPVAVQCLKKQDIPAEPKRVAGDLNGDAVHDLDIVGASAIELRQAYREAVALLTGCAG